MYSVFRSMGMSWKENIPFSSQGQGALDKAVEYLVTELSLEISDYLSEADNGENRGFIENAKLTASAL